MHLHDTQNQKDDRQLSIDRVGVKNLRYPIEIRDRPPGAGKDEALSSQSTVALIQLTVDLPHHFKGTHMSRFVEVLNSHGSILHVLNIRDILEQLLVKLDSEQAHVDFEFPFFIKKAAPVTQATALIDYNVCFKATLTKKNREDRAAFDFVVTVVVPVTTLCPCSKAISQSGAHNQRGQVTFSVRCARTMWIEEMIRLVEDSASCELYTLLKRPDEKFVTEHAYKNPVFVEDLVRNIAQRAEANSNILWYRIEAENFESIHNHNAYALIEKKGARPHS
ncbi:MAG: GTP cyclohydrolase FolE2 [Verrucomicrobiae bacterium]|jgi:GTP cyclohydrolase I|nr:GTP cyclohydrolase FolE2 [Verrucomicrobiae bacterium]